MQACRVIGLFPLEKSVGWGGFRRRVAQLSTMDLFEPAPNLPDGPCPAASQHDPGPTGASEGHGPYQNRPQSLGARS